MSTVSFLNVASVETDYSLEEITDFLSSQILINQVLAIKSLENTYRQRLLAWDCKYRDVFRERTFGSDFDALITDRDNVLMYIYQWILSEIGLDEGDFYIYLLRIFHDGLTSYRLIRGYIEYTTKSMDYYFPENDENGLSQEEWSDASLSCENLLSTFKWN
jgi:hypothetical protein